MWLKLWVQPPLRAFLFGSCHRWLIVWSIVFRTLKDWTNFQLGGQLCDRVDILFRFVFICLLSWFLFIVLRLLSYHNHSFPTGLPVLQWLAHQHEDGLLSYVHAFKTCQSRPSLFDECIMLRVDWLMIRPCDRWLVDAKVVVLCFRTAMRLGVHTNKQDWRSSNVTWTQRWTSVNRGTWRDSIKRHEEEKLKVHAQTQTDTRASKVQNADRL